VLEELRRRRIDRWIWEAKLKFLEAVTPPPRNLELIYDGVLVEKGSFPKFGSEHLLSVDVAVRSRLW
jgi:hypothetical protein